MLYTLPNLLTLSRILVIPILCAAFWLPRPWNDGIALGMFLAAGITDWADGHLARRLGQMSELGRFLDPVADKLLVAAAILMLVAFGRIEGFSILAAVVIMCREIMVAGLREFLAEIRVKVPVSRLAKWKTTVQMVALAFLLASDLPPAWTRAPEIGLGLLWVAALLTLYTGYDYMQSGLKHMTAIDEKRKGLTMRVLYFAWLRERVGLAEEDIAPPADIATVGALIAWLRGRGENYEAAFARPEVVRAAVNQVHAKHDRPIAPGDEIALFPPVTGG